jgi:hypothetical protein
VLGLTETVILMKRSFVAQRRQARDAAASAAIETADVPPPDEEVLRELGAFDATDEPEPPASGEASGARAATTVDAAADAAPGPVGQPKRA